MSQRRKGFKTVDYEDLLEGSVNIRECLPPDHLARFVVAVIAQLDLDRLYARYDRLQNALYAPEILLGLLFYGYSTGVLSSHKIEQATYESIPFYYIAGGLHPDYRTITEFRRSLLTDLQELFVQILVFARSAGVLKMGNIYLDKINIYAGASNDKTINYERLLELKKLLRGEVSELLALGAKADQQEFTGDLVVEDEIGFRRNPQTGLARARAILETCVRQRGGAKRPAYRDQIPVARRPYTPIESGKDSVSAAKTHNPILDRRLNCRDCSMRQRCIEAAALGPGVKLAIERMFESHTDTLEVWTKLQENCQSTKNGSNGKPAALQASALFQRLNQSEYPLHEPLAPKPRYATPLPPVEPKPRTRHNVTAQSQDPPSEDIAYSITCVDTRRVVPLPHRGQVVLGRLEPNFSNPPDVNLAADDGVIPSVSRRHACISVSDGAHWLEDLGSANGTYLNGYRLALGETARLNPGDRILLGRCRLVYNPTPEHILESEAPVRLSQT